MAYIYMPLFFTIIGYGVVYLAALPLINTISSVAQLMTSSTEPMFDTELKSIYDIPASEDEQKTSILLSEITMPASETLYGHISCDRISLDAPLYFGDTTTVLKSGVGQYTGSFLPGFGRPLLLAAHNTTYFLPLADIKEGDTVTITTTYGIYKYEITGMQVANKNDTSAYDLSQEEEQLIMYTCYPFNTLGDLENRYFVYGNKISGPVVVYD